MSWKLILKQSERDDDIDSLMQELESWEDVGSLNLDDWMEWEDKFNNLSMDESDRRRILKEIDNFWKAKDNLVSALQGIQEYLHGEKGEKREVHRQRKRYIGISTGAEGTPENIHPDFIGYELKDDEQWGEGMDGKLIPKPLDDMYGAEW
jgi:serine/threonine protein kinase